MQTSLVMWQGVLCWSEKARCVADMPDSEKKYLLSEQLSRRVIFLCRSLVIFYCLLFNFAFSFLFYKLSLFWLLVQARPRTTSLHLELCAKQIIHDKCASVDKPMPIPDTGSVWQNMQRSETFTFAGAGSDDLFYNCRASAHIFLITFWRDQRREWDVSPGNIIRNTC